jgi:hypothetical protein
MDHASIPSSQPGVAIARIAALILKAFFIVYRENDCPERYGEIQAKPASVRRIITRRSNRHLD